MKKLLCIVAACLALAAGSLSAFAAEDGKPGEKIVATLNLQAEVVKIDHKTRDVVLKGPNGGLVEINADERVKNLDKVKVGDIVNVKMVRSFALFIRKSETDRGAAGLNEVTVFPDGDEPGRITVETIEETAVVQKIDYKKRVAVLKDVDGNVFTLDVPKEVQNLKNVKVGDELVVRYTEAVAVSVTKP